jgi:hypothetical protein
MSTQWVKDTLQSILQLLPDSGLLLELEITDTVHRLGQLHDQLKEYSHRLFASGDPGFVDVVGQSSGTRTRVHVHTPPTSYANVFTSAPAVSVPQVSLTGAVQGVIDHQELIKKSRYGSIDQMYQGLTQWLDVVQPGHPGVRKINGTGSGTAYFECACADMTGCDFSVRFRKHTESVEGDTPAVSWKLAGKCGGSRHRPMVWQHSAQCMQTCKPNPRPQSQRSIEKSPAAVDLVRQNPSVNAATVRHVLSVRMGTHWCWYACTGSAQQVSNLTCRLCA